MSGSNTITLTLGKQFAAIPSTEVNTTEVPAVSNSGTQYAAIKVDAAAGAFNHLTMKPAFPRISKSLLEKTAHPG